MRKYSVAAIVREAFRYHTGWERAWRSPEPKKEYDVIIIGAGGHGLATAYYLGKNYGIKNDSSIIEFLENKDLSNMTLTLEVYSGLEDIKSSYERLKNFQNVN